MMEAYATAPKHESAWGTQIPGPPVGVYPLLVTGLAKRAFPERQEEIVEGLSQGLGHTNAWCRVVALDCMLEFPEQLGRWKKLLLQLPNDKDETVQEAALGNLLMIVQQQKFYAVMPPTAQIASKVTAKATGSTRIKDLARSVHKLAAQAVVMANRPFPPKERL